MLYFMIDNLTYGGAERQATYLIENSIGVDELVLLENHIKYELKTSIPIRSIHSKILRIYQRPLGDSFAVKELSKVYKDRDTVISFLERSNIANIKISLNTGHRSIISVRNYMSERYKEKKYFFRMKLIKKYYPKADLIIVNSIDSKNDLVNNFDVPEEKIKVIYNLIDIEKINSLKNDSIEDEYKEIFEYPVILNIGSLIPQKSQKQLIDAFKRIKQSNPEYKMVIIGDGKLYEVLEQTIKENGLIRDVFLLGNTNNPFKYLNKADMFVLNSKFEGFPNVLLESLATGIPVVTKNCLSGPAEMLKVLNYKNEEIKLTKYGYIFPRKAYEVDEKKELSFLIDAINRMIDFKKNDLKSYDDLKINCINRAMSFSVDNIVEEWIKVIE
ncbi:glycosyltransferase [Alkalibacterium kapii]|uniref:N-acetylgalactosamine-N,N'-diacetylbacillosaminyl-diphospho-undecaprenol 4-alpha-N-acetylgalactosaminyltransferase n=1 Tax=Alkalibacterium kapii TaxID=426704 RepID=A0A511AZL0_9LACT|nr:glycosyltransferase [Alkalibacterium kapii]GEK91037.1 N-acetylgalactosamine-N,N'-diacetylbacillosaminyl-diphospho-undecaprenol 4-alpha-N-acetylgalactosaminyltransferase [Alkalibacterium kapii]